MNKLPIILTVIIFLSRMRKEMGRGSRKNSKWDERKELVREREHRSKETVPRGIWTNHFHVLPMSGSRFSFSVSVHANPFSDHYYHWILVILSIKKSLEQLVYVWTPKNHLEAWEDKGSVGVVGKRIHWFYDVIKNWRHCWFKDQTKIIGFRFWPEKWSQIVTRWWTSTMILS